MPEKRLEGRAAIWHLWKHLRKYSLRRDRDTAQFCVKVSDKQKVGPGGGLVEEGEISVTGAREFISRCGVKTDCQQVSSPIFLLFGIQWYLQNRLSRK